MLQQACESRLNELGHSFGNSPPGPKPYQAHELTFDCWSNLIRTAHLLSCLRSRMS